MKPSDFSIKLPDYNVVSFLSPEQRNSSNDSSSTVTHLCSYCNTYLHYDRTDERTGKKIFVCTKCQIEYIPDNQHVRRASTLDAPEGPNKELLTATPNDSPKASSTRYVDKQQNLSPLFRALEQRGFTFRHYEEH
jgi:hypothetical protein